ncbi:MAG: hypothetical protein BWY09_02414 [Candidatus Hydrogenedentes bacterium ADurb.Bin179]|nr:MAG: hypothetical protein BWY09_02414 [Candidatus Hydrogenedentes bacterium ADurb.Bin179]
MALPLRFQYPVVARLRRAFLMVTGVQITRILRQFRHLLPVQIVVKRIHLELRMVIGYCDLDGLTERHLPVTDAGSAI